MYNPDVMRVSEKCRLLFSETDYLHRLLQAH